ncbi:MAG: hypothetical protein N2423_10605 [Novosphingobium sp.]|nr:hypothetical protein [Novosphingobium sp.]
MKNILLAGASLAAALVLAAGTAAAAKDRPSNRGYVVGAGGVARLANDAGAQDEPTPADQAAAVDTQAQRLVIKTKSSPPVAEPIGVNEPGVNRAASSDYEGTYLPVIRGSAGMKIDSGMPQRSAMDAPVADPSQGMNRTTSAGAGGGAASASYAATGRAPSPVGDAPAGSETEQVRMADPVQPD